MKVGDTVEIEEENAKRYAEHVAMNARLQKGLEKIANEHYMSVEELEAIRSKLRELWPR